MHPDPYDTLSLSTYIHDGTKGDSHKVVPFVYDFVLNSTHMVVPKKDGTYEFSDSAQYRGKALPRMTQISFVQPMDKYRRFVILTVALDDFGDILKFKKTILDDFLKGFDKFVESFYHYLENNKP